MKVIRVLALLFTIGACLAPLIGPWLKKGQPPALMEVVIALVMDALLAWPLFWFFSLYLLLFAHVLRGLSWVTSLGAELSPVGTLKFSVLAKLTRAMSRALIPQLEVKRVATLDGAPLRGVTTAPVTLHFVRDGWGFMERFDVHAPSPLPVKFDSGESQELALTHGGVDLEVVGTRREGSELPSWLEVPKRSGVRFQRELPKGTRFVLTRGHDARMLLRLL